MNEGGTLSPYKDLIKHGSEEGIGSVYDNFGVSSIDFMQMSRPIISLSREMSQIDLGLIISSLRFISFSLVSQNLSDESYGIVKDPHFQSNLVFLCLKCGNIDATTKILTVFLEMLDRYPSVAPIFASQNGIGMLVTLIKDDSESQLRPFCFEVLSKAVPSLHISKELLRVLLSFHPNEPITFLHYSSLLSSLLISVTEGMKMLLLETVLTLKYSMKKMVPLDVREEIHCKLLQGLDSFSKRGPKFSYYILKFNIHSIILSMLSDLSDSSQVLILSILTSLFQSLDMKHLPSLAQAFPSDYLKKAISEGSDTMCKAAITLVQSAYNYSHELINTEPSFLDLAIDTIIERPFNVKEVALECLASCQSFHPNIYNFGTLIDTLIDIAELDDPSFTKMARKLLFSIYAHTDEGSPERERIKPLMANVDADT